MPATSLYQLLLAGGLVIASTGAAEAARSDDFDGRWAVEIAPANGECRAQTVALNVDEGRISYAGLGATANGTIESDGDLAVTISHREKVVNASGSVDGAMGAGNWVSPDCTGTWTARRS